MNLADCVAQCRTAFVVRHRTTDRIWTLNNTVDFARPVASCPIRYVLSDDLTRLCADLAYSTGARTVRCSDLLRVPATALWLEWCNEPWQRALERYGFPLVSGTLQWVGRRGALIQASSDGRRGQVRTFWTAGAETLTSSIEAYFDFDADGEVRPPADGADDSIKADESIRADDSIRVHDDERRDEDDVLARCFRFRYERTWAEYYGAVGLSEAQKSLLWRHALGTIAMDVPMLLAFFLLLSTRNGLPQQARDCSRLNRARHKSGRAPLLDHIEIRAPLLPEYAEYRNLEPDRARRGPRLHHVRGHLVRRGSRLFWRVPHLRGSARSGIVKSRTVVWTLDNTQQRRRDLGGHRSSLSAEGNPAVPSA
jgi:hypothetical protein